jgi:hypothetical protein
VKVELIEERWKKFENWSLKSGAHSPDSTFCVMEAVAYVAGEEWSDHPECACPIISTFLRGWNDGLPSDAERDRLLKSLIPRLINTRSTREVELKRGLMAADWLIRVHTPAWLRLAGLIKQAESLEQLPEITAIKQFPSILGPIKAVRQDAAAAGAAVWNAARAAARDAARAAARAAAGDAVWNAAWDAVGAAAGDAAGDAVGAAAGAAAGAAVRNAVRAAAWDAVRAAAGAAAWDAVRAAVRANLAPTVKHLQDSSLELVNRMIEVKP